MAKNRPEALGAGHAPANHGTASVLDAGLPRDFPNQTNHREHEADTEDTRQSLCLSVSSLCALWFNSILALLRVQSPFSGDTKDGDSPLWKTVAVPAQSRISDLICRLGSS